MRYPIIKHENITTAGYHHIPGTRGERGKSGHCRKHVSYFSSGSWLSMVTEILRCALRHPELRTTLLLKEENTKISISEGYLMKTTRFQKKKTTTDLCQRLISLEGQKFKFLITFQYFFWHENQHHISAILVPPFNFKLCTLWVKPLLVRVWSESSLSEFRNPLKLDEVLHVNLKTW